MPKRDFYVVLGVGRSESPAGIRAAFRELVRRYHPDRAGPASTRFYRDVVEAYAVLSDAEQRRAYDRGLVHGDRQRERRAPTVVMPRPPDRGGAEPLVPAPVAVLDGVRVARPTFDELFARVLSNFLRPEQGWSRGLEPLPVEVAISRRQALRGGVLTVAVPVFYPCTACHGTGWSEVLPCGYCHGAGLREEEQTLQLDLPPLLPDGASFQLPLRGLGVQNMYLLLRVRVAD